MIGERYWSTGIDIDRRDDRWVVGLRFFDDGVEADLCSSCAPAEVPA